MLITHSPRRYICRGCNSIYELTKVKTMVKRDDLIRIVAFCVKMQSGGGIQTKSPEYIAENYERYMKWEPSDNIKGGFDAANANAFDFWMDHWGDLLPEPEEV